MKIRTRYTTQLKMALGTDTEEIELPEPSSLKDLLIQLRQLHPKEVDQYILNADNQLQSGVLVCIDDKHAGRDLSLSLAQGDEVTLLSVVSGG